MPKEALSDLIDSRHHLDKSYSLVLEQHVKVTQLHAAVIQTGSNREVN